MIFPKPGSPGSSQILRKNFADYVLSAWKSLPAYFPLALALLLLLTAATVENYVGNPDVRLYQCYASTFWYGAKAFQILPASQCQPALQVAQYHSFPLEYPPLALVIFSLPLLGPVVEYPALFALLMAMLVTIIYQLLLRYYSRRTAAYFTTSLLVGGLATSLTRFDLLPAALSLVCLILAERKHWTLANVALALGVLVKIYPIVLFPILFLAEQREQASFLVPELSKSLKTAAGGFFQILRSMRNWHWKNGLIFTGLVIGASAFFGGLSSNGAFSWASYLYLRPFAVESTGSALLWLASFAGIPVAWNTSFGSWNIISPIAGALSQGFMILFWAGYIYIVIQQWRGKIGFFQACLAALLVLIATGKIFSPQYLLWLMPFIAISATGNRRLWHAWVGIACLTTLIYPVFYGIILFNQTGSQMPGFLPVILLRDGLVMLLTVAYLFNFL